MRYPNEGVPPTAHGGSCYGEVLCHYDEAGVFPGGVDRLLDSISRTVNYDAERHARKRWVTVGGRFAGSFSVNEADHPVGCAYGQEDNIVGVFRDEAETIAALASRFRPGRGWGAARIPESEVPGD